MCGGKVGEEGRGGGGGLGEERRGGGGGEGCPFPPSHV